MGICMSSDSPRLTSTHNSRMAAVFDDVDQVEILIKLKWLAVLMGTPAERFYLSLDSASFHIGNSAYHTTQRQLPWEMFLAVLIKSGDITMQNPIGGGSTAMGKIQGALRELNVTYELTCSETGYFKQNTAVVNSSNMGRLAKFTAVSMEEAVAASTLIACAEVIKRLDASIVTRHV